MNKSFPDIGFFLAERAIIEYYRPYRQIARLEALEEFCKNKKSMNLYRTYLRLQRQHIDRVIVGVVLENLPDRERDFMRYHYRDRMGYYMITHKLPYSTTALSRMNKRILGDIRTMLFYSLSSEDIFYTTKVLTMIHVLDFRIQALLSRQDLPVKTQFLKNLLRKRMGYRRLLNIMQKCLEEEYPMQKERFADLPLPELQNAVVYTKLQNPACNISEISRLSGISAPTVSRKLRQYMVAAYAIIH